MDDVNKHRGGWKIPRGTRSKPAHDLARVNKGEIGTRAWVYIRYTRVCVCAASGTMYVLGALRHNLMCAASGNVLPRRTTLEPRASLRLVHRHRLAASTYVSCSAGPIPRWYPGLFVRYSHTPPDLSGLVSASV